MTWQIATFDLFDSGIDSTLSNSTNSTVTDLMQISSSFYLLQMGKAVHPIKQSDGMKLKQYCSFMHAQVTCSCMASDPEGAMAWQHYMHNRYYLLMNLQYSFSI